ncbi:hypothetical protein MGI18_06655 [Bacillus sp. OVS6]|nr:hypothetical protein MGI18_06655 [Bacillus sp. OVS6]
MSEMVVSLNEEENQDIDPHTEYKALNQDFLQTKERFQKLQSIEREWQEKINHNLYTHKNNEEDLKELNEKHGQIESEYLAGLEKWNGQFSGLSFLQAEEKQRQISEKDAVLEDLKARVKISVQFIEEKEKQIKQLEHEAQQIKNTQIELSASVQNRQQAADEKQKRLNQETVNGDIASLLQETERTLEELVQKEKIFTKSGRLPCRMFKRLKAAAMQQRRHLNMQSCVLPSLKRNGIR